MLSANIPKFNSNKFEVNVNTGSHNISKSIISFKDKVTTCGETDSYFSISSDKFEIDKNNGNVYLTDSVLDGGTYEMTITINNGEETEPDSATLVVNVMRLFDDNNGDSINVYHHRSKRATVSRLKAYHSCIILITK